MGILGTNGLTVIANEAQANDNTTSVNVATTGNITLSGEQTIDGVLTSASSVLAWQQTDQKTNGIYTSAAGAWSRRTDSDTGQEIVGSQFSVSSGTTYSGFIFKNTNEGPVVIGTTNITYAVLFNAQHNNLQGLQGGTTNQYYHLTSAEYTGNGTGVFVRTSAPILVSPTSNNFISGYQSQTGGTTIILTSTSNWNQVISNVNGASIVILPDATTLSIGWSVSIYSNGSTGTLEIKNSGGTSLIPGAFSNPNYIELICTSISTTNGAWLLKNFANALSGSGTEPSIVYRNASGLSRFTTVQASTFTLQDSGINIKSVSGSYNFNLPATAGTSGDVLLSGGGVAVAMTWSTPTGTGSVVKATSPTLITPILGVASATSLATSAASPLLLTNGQLVTIILTSQTVGATTLTIPDFAGVVDEFTFKTKSQTLSNKTFIAPVLGAATGTSLTLSDNGNTNKIILTIRNTNSGSSAYTSLYLLNDGGSGNPNTGFLLNSSTNAGLGGNNAFNVYQGGNFPLTLCTNDTVRLTVSGAGAIRFNTGYGVGTITSDANGNLTSVSDERLKIFQSHFEKGLSEIIQINPVNYKHKKESGLDTEYIYTGFFAQHVQKYIPEAVYTKEDGFLSFSDRPIIAALVNAVKELNSRLLELECHT